MGKLCSLVLCPWPFSRRLAVRCAADSRPTVNQWIPADAIVVLEAKQPKSILNVFTNDQMIATIGATTAYQNLMQTDQSRESLAMLRYLEARLGTDWRTGLQKLIGGGVTIAILPEDAVLLAVEAEDAALLEKLHGILLEFVQAEETKQGQPERVKSADYRGMTGWTFGGDEAHVILDGRLLMTNKPDLLKEVIDLSLDANPPRLAALPKYQAAQEAAEPDAEATLFVDMERIRQHPPIQQALDSSTNPLATLLLADMLEALGQADWLMMDLQTEDHSLCLRARTDTDAAAVSPPVAFAEPPEAAWDSFRVLSVPRQIATAFLFRDLYAFYAAKDDLFPDRTSGLIFFENMMGIFFSGRDLTEEVLAETTPEIHIVVAEQQYDAEVGTPRVRIPAFAAVLRLQNPTDYRIVAEEAWQKAIGLVNFTRGQQGLPGLIIDRFTHSDVKFTTAYFATQNVPDRTALETRHNLQPSLAMFDDYIILSSGEALTRDLIDAIKTAGEPEKTLLDRPHTLVRLQGDRLASILRSNQEQMIRNNMIEEGHERAQAEAEIETLLDGRRPVGTTSSRVGNTQRSSPGSPRIGSPMTISVEQQNDPKWAWAPYQPDEDRPWNLRWAGHLFRRAAWGGTTSELRQAVQEGPRRTIDRLLKPQGDIESFERTYEDLEASSDGEESADLLRAWWLRRMLLTPDPLRERMTLFWHHYFAISNQVVRNSTMMRRHVALMREHALGQLLETAAQRSPKIRPR